MDNSKLNNLFTRTSFKHLLIDKRSCYVERYLDVVNEFIGEDNVDNRFVIKRLYKYLEKDYRNEYLFLNNIKNQLLINKNNIKTTKALTEQRVNKSKADYIIINGEANVYEVKTGLDTFNRVESQINDYLKAFKYVNVVLDYTNYKQGLNTIKDNRIGIYVLGKDNKLVCDREAKEIKQYLNHEVIFKILWKKEYEAIIKEEYGYLPDVSDFIYPIKCLNMIENIDIEKFHYLAIEQLKNRIKNNNYILKESVPYELKYLSYYLVDTKEMYDKLNKFLNAKWRDFCVFSYN